MSKEQPKNYFVDAQPLNMISLILFGATMFNLLLLLMQVLFSIGVMYDHLALFWMLIPGALFFCSLVFLCFRRNRWLYLSIVVNAGVMGLFWYALATAFA